MKSLAVILSIVFASSGLAQRIAPATSIDSFGNAVVQVQKTNHVWLAKAKPNKKPEIEKKVKQHGPKNKSKHFTYLNLIRLDIDNPELVDLLREDVEYITPDTPVSIDAVPTDPMWSQQWDMPNISMPSAWDKTQGNPEIVVAIYDTGIDFTHPDLSANLYTDALGFHGWTCVNGKMVEGGMDDYGHGTHVAGTIGATANNGIGISGVNWRIKLMSMKFLNIYGSGWTSDILTLMDKTIELKANGVNVRIGNNSWGGSGNEVVLRDAYQKLEDAGILSVCAAGNASTDIDVYPFQPAGLSNRGILSVLASDSSNKLASFSNYGFVGTDVSAPGASILSTVSTNLEFIISDATGYRLASGTSMACPHVAGLAALTLALNPNLSVYELKDVILSYQSTDEMTEMGLLSTTGAKINAQKTLSNPLVLTPKTNSPPVLSDIKSYDVLGGQTGIVSFAAGDPNFDSIRYLTVDRYNRIASLTNVFHHKTENRLLGASFPFFVGASDKNGGSASGNVFLNVYNDPATFDLQDYEIGISATNIGSDLMTRVWLKTNSQPTKEVYFKPYVTGNMYNGWNYNWVPIGTGFTATYRGFLNTNASYMVKAYTDNYQLAPHADSERIIIRLGTDATNTMPLPELSVHVDKLSGVSPLTIKYAITNLANSKTNNLFFAIGSVGNCGNCNQTKHQGSYYNGTITYTEIGIRSLAFLVQDYEHGTNWDVKEYKVSVLAPSNSVPVPPPFIPTAPTALSVTMDSSAMFLNWLDNATGEDRYELEMTEKKKGAWPPFKNLITLPPNTRGFVYSEGIKNYNYQFRVRAGSGTTVSDYSNVAGIRFK